MGIASYHPSFDTVKKRYPYGIMRSMSSAEPQPTELADTQNTTTAADSPDEPKPGLWRRLRWFLLLFVVASLLAGVGGYFAGIEQRQQARQAAVHAQAEEQFRRGVEDLEAGRYELARQRLEYVIQLDPSYPGAPERLAEALLQLNRPTASPTVAATPTPNLAPVQELFDQAQQALREENWTAAVQTLRALRKKDPEYRAVDVDGMMYVALRNRGVQRISEEGMLAEGMYDLAQAETFGPLDRDASNWRSWAALYLKADSYMGVNWAQAVSQFAQVYLVAPYLRNDAYIKYAVSAQNYADQLVQAGDPCAAEGYYDESLLAWDNGTVYPTATEARDMCRTATAPPPRPPTDEPTATPDGEAPTPTPTETPTATEE